MVVGCISLLNLLYLLVYIFFLFHSSHSSCKPRVNDIFESMRKGTLCQESCVKIETHPRVIIVTEHACAEEGGFAIAEKTPQIF